MRLGFVRFIYELPCDLDDSLMVEEAEKAIIGDIQTLDANDDLIGCIHAKVDETVTEKDINDWRNRE